MIINTLLPFIHIGVFSGLDTMQNQHGWLYYFILKLRGSCLYWYVAFGSQLSFLAADMRRKKRGKVCRFNFAGLRSRRFSFLCLALCCCTCLLFILRSEKEESGWWEKPTFSPLWGCSCILPNCLMKGTFVLQWNISPFTSSWCGLPSFFIFRKTLRLSSPRPP